MPRQGMRTRLLRKVIFFIFSPSQTILQEYSMQEEEDANPLISLFCKKRWIAWFVFYKGKILVDFPAIP